MWLWLAIACTGPSDTEDWCAEPGLICRVAGTGQLGFNGDGLPAEESWLYWPSALEFTAEGQLAVVDFNNMRIRVLTSADKFRTIAGSGDHAWSHPGSTAKNSALENPVDVAFLPDGSFYIAALHEARILYVGLDGHISAVAGTGTEGFSGDGGLAADAELSEAAGITTDDAGNLYIADTQNHCIRQVSPDGQINTLAGHGMAGYAGDGDDLDGVMFNTPERIKWWNGSLYVADSFNHAIRRLDLETREVESVAGIGVPGYSGDGGPASEATLNTPYGMDIAPDGTLYIADSGNNVIRRVDPDGTISTLAGTGIAGFTGDDGPALEATLSLPVDVLVEGSDPVTGLYVADMRNGAIRYISLP